MAQVNCDLFEEQHLVTYDGVALPADQLAVDDVDIKLAFALGYETAKAKLLTTGTISPTGRPSPGLYHVEAFGLILQREHDAWFTAIGGSWVPLSYEWWDGEHLAGRGIMKYIGMDDVLIKHIELTIEEKL